MSAEMLKDLKPKSEPERQIAVKIIDTNFRLNRLTAIENNMFSFGIRENEHPASDNEDRIEVMGAQTRPGSSITTSSTPSTATKLVSSAS